MAEFPTFMGSWP